jgi:IS5 family transposase
LSLITCNIGLFSMRPKADPISLSNQASMVDDNQPPLSDFINMRHPLVVMADNMKWQDFEAYWCQQFGTAGGPMASSGRRVAGLLMLKHMEGLSDERLIEAWVRDPYHQYFCGETHFQHQPPIDPATLVKWRKRLGEQGMERLLSMVLSSAVQAKAVKRGSLAHVCVDSTVMEKNIAYPTDSALLLKALQKIVALARTHDLQVRQSYARVAVRLAQQIGRYAHARQFKRMRRALKKLSTLVGRVVRELQRQLNQLPDDVKERAIQLIAQAKQLRKQAADPKCKDKLYSLHEPDVDCISKGKARKRYEFGTKVGITCTQKEGFVLGIRSYPNNPYDGHTLDDALQQAETISGMAIKTAAVDLGYRGRHRSIAEIIHRGKKLSKGQKKRLRRRSMLEAMIGHMKNDGLLDKCHLKGKLGDAIHAILCGVGHNLRLLYNFWAAKLLKLLFPLLGTVLNWCTGLRRSIYSHQTV